MRQWRSSGVRTGYTRDGTRRLRPSHLPRVVRSLVAEGWHVEAEGKLYRRASGFAANVSSGIDWFDLNGQADFDGVTAGLPALLAALRKGENIVQLRDGTFGILPGEWLRKFDLLSRAGKVNGEHVRFSRQQAAMLDALLAAQPEVACDAVFAQVREELRRFERVEPADTPDTFTGVLRGYQRDGLGGLNFLRRFGFGGCLADDMGLGKTVQVLALLESRRLLRAGAANGNGRPGPSLAVVPRSLVSNWRQEAARFTPALRVLDHIGTTRTKDSTQHFEDYDLVLTTYGTLRRDIVHLKDVTAAKITTSSVVAAVRRFGPPTARASQPCRSQRT